MTNMGFGERLKMARKETRKKLREVASATGLSISYISDLEHERKKAPSIEIARSIEKFLGLAHGFLCEAAQAEHSTNSELKEIAYKRPMLNLGLLRVTDGMTDEELAEIIDEIKSRKEGKNSGEKHHTPEKP